MNKRVIGELMKLGGITWLLGYLWGHRVVYIWLLIVLIVNGIAFFTRREKRWQG